MLRLPFLDGDGAGAPLETMRSQLFDQFDTWCSPAGLASPPEMVDPTSGAFGNMPQGLSHLPT
jgi:hypothetical protein